MLAFIMLCVYESSMNQIREGKLRWIGEDRALYTHICEYMHYSSFTVGQHLIREEEGAHACKENIQCVFHAVLSAFRANQKSSHWERIYPLDSW
jgi:hypothetical protein